MDCWRWRRQWSDGRSWGLPVSILQCVFERVDQAACDLALSERSPLVQRRHLEAALAVWQYCFDSAAYVFGFSLGDPTADAILQSLRNAADIGMTRTDISKLFGRNRSATDIDRAMTVLESHGLARRGSRDTGGRPAECWFFDVTGYERNEKRGEGEGVLSFNSFISYPVELPETEAGEL